MEFVKSYWRIALSLAIAVSFVIYSFFAAQPAAITDLSKLLSICLTAILALQLAESIDIRARFKEARANSQQDLKNALHEASAFSTRLVEVTKTSDYVDLFADLTDEFLSYNPHQFSQELSLDESEIIANLRRRYKNDDFRQARFLICVGDEEGRDNFRRYMLRLYKIWDENSVKREIRKKILIRLSRKPFLSEPTFHLQHKRSNRCVIELRIPGLTVERTSAPRIYLVSDFEALLRLQRTYFLAEFAQEKDLDLGALLHQMDNSPNKEAAVDSVVQKFVSTGASA